MVVGFGLKLPRREFEASWLHKIINYTSAVPVDQQRENEFDVSTTLFDGTTTIPLVDFVFQEKCRNGSFTRYHGLGGKYNIIF